MSIDLRRFEGRPLQELVNQLFGSDFAELLRGSSQQDTSLGRAVRTRGGADESTTDDGRAHLDRYHLPPNLPQVTIPQVTLVRFLGRGSHGVVYLGQVIPTDRQVAVKILPAAGVGGTEYAMREALACARMNHPSIVRVLRVEQLPGFWVIIMEFVCGKPLASADVVPSERQLFGHLADALWSMANSQIVHQDVKPQNIILRDHDRSPVLIDFGLTVDLRAEEWIQPTRPGSPLYMAPEVFLGSKPAPSLDWYSLGMTTVEVFVGFSQRNLELTGTQLAAAKTSGEFNILVQKCLKPHHHEWFAGWCLELIAADTSRRHAAILEARRWRGSF